ATPAGMQPTVKVLDVSAPEALQSDKLVYRLGSADSQQVAAYANSHWTMPPSVLLTQRLRGALSSRGTVLTMSMGKRLADFAVDSAATPRTYA
ncbi:ABC transporter, partial [bacterium M00.F.Ca.ET.180.01.1.1]